MRGKARRKSSLRPDTTVAPAGRPEAEVYVRELPLCCLRSLKREARAEPSAEPEAEKRLLELGCPCGRSWRITSSLDDRVLGRFVTHGGPRAGGGTHPAA